MARPILKRNADTMQRDIESLGRLRTAVLIDTDMDPSDVQETVVLIDKLIKRLSDLIKP